MKPFYLLSARPEDAALNAEYDSFLASSRLHPNELIQIRLAADEGIDLEVTQAAGIFLGGSPFGTTTTTKTQTQKRVEAQLNAIISAVQTHDIPCLATGFSMEVLTCHYGGLVDSYYSEDPYQTTIKLTAAGQNDPLMRGLPDSFPTVVAHQEACRELPENAVLLASSSGCPVQAVRFGPRLYGTQFNPELDSDAMMARLQVYVDAGLYAPDDLIELSQLVVSAGEHTAGQILQNFVTLART